MSHMAGFKPHITASTTFGEIDKLLAQTRLKVLSLSWQTDEEAYYVRIGHHQSRFKHIYFGTGKTLHGAMTSALDEYVIHMANTYARERTTP
jgi:hypothetical protein